MNNKHYITHLLGKEDENIHLAEFVVKINRKEKGQIRLLLITNRAAYSFILLLK